MPARRLLVVLCLVLGASTVSIGAFPALLPEVGAAAGLADWQLGAVAGAFGFARVVADVPVGLFITHRLSGALRLVPVFLLTGAALLAAGGGDFVVLLLGRALMGAGQTLATLAGLTAILRHRAGPKLASSLAALELSAMLGVLVGAAVIGALPRTIPWNTAFLVACLPTVASLVLLPALLRLLPASEVASRPLFARSEAALAPAAPLAGSRATLIALLAGVAGAVVAVSYSTVEQFLIPIRGSRMFELDRVGIARLLMLGQAVDIVTLLPLGALADRRGATPVLGGVLLTLAVAVSLLGFGSLPLMLVGCMLFGLGMAGWNLPLSVLRSVTPAGQVSWRTALYRVAVDGGLCLGPLVAGLLTARHGRVLPGVLIVLLLTTGLTLLVGTAVAPTHGGSPACEDGGSGSSAPSGC